MDVLYNIDWWWMVSTGAGSSSRGNGQGLTLLLIDEMQVTYNIGKEGNEKIWKHIKTITKCLDPLNPSRLRIAMAAVYGNKPSGAPDSSSPLTTPVEVHERCTMGFARAGERGLGLALTKGEYNELVSKFCQQHVLDLSREGRALDYLYEVTAGQVM